MTTFFLKFENEQQAKDSFIAAGATLTGAGTIPPSARIDGKNMAIDVLFGNGVIYSQTGKTVTGIDESGNVVDVQENAPIAGYHVNVTYVPDSLIPYQLPEPDFPKCIFA